MLETPGKTAALVTPDRALADRVASELRRFGVEADDSAGAPLERAPLAAFAALVLNCALEDAAPPAVLAMLANPCLRWSGEPPPAEASAALELLGFRGVSGRVGLDGLASALDDAEARQADRRAHPALRRVRADALAAARGLLGFVVDALRPLMALRRAEAAASVFAAAHLEALEALAGARASEGADGEAVSRIPRRFRG